MELQYYSGEEVKTTAIIEAAGGSVLGESKYESFSTVYTAGASVNIGGVEGHMSVHIVDANVPLSLSRNFMENFKVILQPVRLMLVMIK